MWTVLRTAFNNWSRHRTTTPGRGTRVLLRVLLGSASPHRHRGGGLTSSRGGCGARLDQHTVSGASRTDWSAGVEAMLKGAASSTTGGWTAISGIVLLLVAAVGVVVQLKDALNTIFEADEPANASFGWYARVLRHIVRGRSRAPVSPRRVPRHQHCADGVFRLVRTLDGQSGPHIRGEFCAVTRCAFTAVCDALQWFPDKPISWRAVWPGAIATALLFNIGKAAIAWYIGTQGLNRLMARRPPSSCFWCGSTTPRRSCCSGPNSRTPTRKDQRTSGPVARA